ncbi:hypothetical protein LIER_13812 [Lithospermum erythrorhizon]|uniref:Uncharacterized protein n=1 Tax=Lithospermum erythrorhizon TaxID=34254 RepID=A0AAV3PZ07_LITER
MNSSVKIYKDRRPDNNNQDDKYTRPQGLYNDKDVDVKKLRKLIPGSKLAPCYNGLEDNALDLEECPIFFLYYPSLNRSRCCTKGTCWTKNEEFDLDLEDIMVMEAIWLSVQENDSHRNKTYGDLAPLEHNTADHCSSATMAPHSGTSSLTPSGGLACAIASLTECQGTSGVSSNNVGQHLYDEGRSYDVPLDSRMMMARHKRERVEHRSDIAEVETINSESEVVEEDRAHHIVQDQIRSDIQAVPSAIVPERFEEQMMLAMAVSLAEAQVRKKYGEYKKKL